MCHGSTFEKMNGPRAVWSAVTLDCVDPRKVAEFWSGLLDVPARAIDLAGWFRIGPTVAGGPVLTFQPVPEEKLGKTRIHLDIWVDDLDEAVRLVEGLGGSATGERHGYEEGTVVVMRDIEGNELCLVGPP
jgi:predicted enzyme related to lactoylglutathione lyase